MSGLSVQNLSYFAGSKQLLHDLSFSINNGEIVAFLGPNGAGKTTLLRSVMGLYKNLPADTASGKNLIHYHNQLLNALPVSDRVSRGLIYLPQHSSLLGQLSVRDNLDLVYQYHETWQNQPRSLFDEKVNHWLNYTSLTSTQEQLAATLSGGQKRKLEIIRSLMMSPQLMLLDEPFAGVDPKSIYELKQIFSDMAALSIGILISDHHVDHLFSIAQRAYVIIGGRNVTSGGIQDILNDTATREMYLGQQFGSEKQQGFSYNTIRGKKE